MVRLTPEEKRLIRARGQERGRPTSTFMREAALASVPRVRPRPLEEQAVHQLRLIGLKLNQLARSANATGRIEARGLLEEALAELVQAMRALP